MRRVALLFLAGMLAGAGTAAAQQLPVTGCRAATNCGYRGFSTLLSSAGEGYSSNLFAISFSVSGGKLQARLATVPRDTVDWQAVEAAVDLFVRRHSLKRPATNGEKPEPAEPESPDPDSSPK